jgi:hypothetical protein
VLERRVCSVAGAVGDLWCRMRRSISPGPKPMGGLWWAKWAALAGVLTQCGLGPARPGAASRFFFSGEVGCPRAEGG